MKTIGVDYFLIDTINFLFSVRYCRIFFLIHQRMKLSCATVVWIVVDVWGIAYSNFLVRQNGSNNFLLYPSKLDLYAQ